jgi:hypothetical protein
VEGGLEELAEVIQGVIDHAGANAQETSAVWEDSNEIKESKYAANLAQNDKSSKEIPG